MRFCALRRNSRWLPKVAGKRFLLKVVSRLFIYPAAKNFIEIALPRTGPKTSVMFHTEIQDGHQKWRESDFCEKSPVHCRQPGGQKFQQNPSISHGLGR